MKNLNFGCKRSDFLVTNSKEDWFIQCRFYEPDRKSHLLTEEDLTILKMKKNGPKLKSFF